MDLAALLIRVIEANRGRINDSGVANRPGTIGVWIEMDIHLGIRRVALRLPNEEPIEIRLPRVA